MSSWSLRSSRSGGWRKTEHARITAALVLRKGRPAARKVYKLIPDIPVLRQSSKPRVFVCYAQAFVVGGHVDCTPLMQDHRQNGPRTVPVELQKHDRSKRSALHAAVCASWTSVAHHNIGVHTKPSYVRLILPSRS